MAAGERPDRPYTGFKLAHAVLAADGERAGFAGLSIGAERGAHARQKVEVVVDPLERGVGEHKIEPLVEPRRDVAAREREAVEHPSLLKKRVLGRVEIFGLALVNDPAAESEHAAARIADGKHQTVAKAVVEPRLAGALATVLTPALLTLDDEPELRQPAALRLVAAESIVQCVPGVGGVPQRELGARGAIDAAFREIILRARAIG